VTLEILDAKGTLVRRFASDDTPEPLVEPLVVTASWARRPRILPASPGMHRFVWDLRLPRPPVIAREYPISAIPHDTPQEPLGPLVLPGDYTVRLTVDGVALARPLTVKMDPRVRISQDDLASQFALLERLTAARSRLDAAHVKPVKGPRRDRASLEQALLRVYGIVESADDAPTSQAVAAVGELEKRVDETLAKKAASP
jgi:hypothetical protein